MKYIRQKSITAAKIRKEKQYITIINNARELANKYKPKIESKRAILSMLYWAEGSKRYDSIITFANTDPQLCHLFIELLRECYTIEENKFRLLLHLQSHHKELEQKRFWSELLNIPLTQFTKTNWKKTPNSGKRYRQNYHGICFVRYNNVSLQRSITAYAHAIADKLIKAPIV